LRRCAARAEARFGRENRTTVAAYNVLGTVLYASKRAREAVDIFTANAAIQRRALGAEHDDTLTSMDNLAVALVCDGRAAEAGLTIHEVLAVRGVLFGADHPRSAHARTTLAEVLAAARRLADAEVELCQMTAAAFEGERLSSELVKRLSTLGGIRIALGRQLDALDAFSTAHAVALQSGPAEGPGFLDITLDLAAQWRRISQPASVPALLEPIYTACSAAGGPTGKRAKACGAMLLKSYDELGRAEDANALRARIAAAGEKP
jgi:hypothetical protein